MATRTITTRLALDGEREYRQQMALVNSELKTLKSEMQLSEATFKGQANSVEALTEKDRILRSEIEQQREKIRALAQAVEDAAEAYGDADKRTDGYRQSLNRAQKELVEMNRELKDTEKHLDEARSSTNGFAKSIDGFGKNVDGSQSMLKNLAEGFDSVKGVLAGGVVAGGVKAVVDAVFDLEESTREYRQIMGTLEVSGEAAGYAAEQTLEAYERLYGVLGDTQAAATTVANLQAIGVSQEDLLLLIDACTGAWGKYGDSIPIDALAEAINETIRSGEVTGNFADVLNWGSSEMETFGIHTREYTEANKEWNDAVNDCTTAEDYFNLALQETDTVAERVQLVMQALTDQELPNLGQEWRDVNDDIVKVNEAQNALDAQWARFGEMVAPAVTALKTDFAGALEWVLDLTEDLWDRLNKPINMELEIDHSLTPEERIRLDGRHSSGLSYVPFDGYIAELHQGERVLTAAENKAHNDLLESIRILESVAGNRGALQAESGVGPRQSGRPQVIQVVSQTVLDGQIIYESQKDYNLRDGKAVGK